MKPRLKRSVLNLAEKRHDARVTGRHGCKYRRDDKQERKERKKLLFVESPCSFFLKTEQDEGDKPDEKRENDPFHC